MTSPMYINAVGMSCPIGLNWRAACAAMRAGLSLFQELPYVDNDGEPITGSRLSLLDEDCTRKQRYCALLSNAISDAFSHKEFERLTDMPVFIVLPDDDNGKPIEFSSIIPHLSAPIRENINRLDVQIVTEEGAYGGYAAIGMAREYLQKGSHLECLVAATDSLVTASPLLNLYETRRLLTEDNSDGVIPGEAAACLSLSMQSDSALAVIRGMGFANEPALLSNEIPLRGDGVTTAARNALNEAGLAMHDMDFRVSDAAGESYAFKEQSLLVTKLLRQRKENFPLWLCAENLGDTGTAAGLCGLISGIAGFARGYAPGDRTIGTVGNLSGQRAAIVLDKQ
nr:hypothetical protein [uncultured Desulfobacter sp.]